MYGLETIRKLNEKTTTTATTTGEAYLDTGTLVGSELCQCGSAVHQNQEEAESSNSKDKGRKEYASELSSFADLEVIKKN